jgi:tetratricopeptide (TPR) repeat protein
MRLGEIWRRLTHASLIAAALYCAPASAQRAEATLLFDEGRASMARQDYTQAIAKFEQSQQLDPAVGTLLNLAECYAALGRTASAWSMYRDAASLARSRKQPERERYASRKAQELEPRLSRLELLIKPEARVAGLSISRSGVPVPEGLWGSAFPVDPGPQRIEATAPGRSTWTRDVEVGSNVSSVQVEVPVLEPAGAPASATPSEDPEARVLTSATAAPAATDAPATGSTSALPTLGWIAIGAGAVTAGAGVFFYANGRSKISDANCPDETCVRGVGDKALHDDGRAHERLGIGLGIAGVAVAATGVVLLLSAPDTTHGTGANLRLKMGASGVQVLANW